MGHRFWARLGIDCGYGQWARRWALFSVLVIDGAVRLVAKGWRLCWYWLFMSVVAVVVIALLDPAWIHHALVLGALFGRCLYPWCWCWQPWEPCQTLAGWPAV